MKKKGEEMRAHPYLIDKTLRGKERRLENIDPRAKDFDEKWLQDLLIRHPDLLPTGEIEPIFHPLMVIGREVIVDQGRIDVLYVSPNGYPVIIETKLWRNPEAKREVVAQVLDLALAFSKWNCDQV
jgi:RecB family endonuclease NucS